MSKGGPEQPWLCLLDVALVHVAAVFLQAIRREALWAKVGFVNPGTTACSHPLDRSLMRPFKCCLQRAASVLLATSLPETLTDDGTFAGDMSIPHLRPLVPPLGRTGCPPAFARAGLGVCVRAQLP